MSAATSGDALRVLVVDDEPLAREGLVESIERLVREGSVRPMTVVAACATASAGEAAIRAHAPDIALVDVRMPVTSGLEMLASLEPESLPPAVLVITAHTAHALDAFGVRALDYLVKPVSRATLATALERAAMRVAEVHALRATMEVPPPIARSSAGAPYLRALVIPERGQRLVIPTREVEWIEGETYYVRVHTARGSRLLRERLGVLADALDPAEFFRTHRSAIVRLPLVRDIRTEGPYSASVLLSTGARVPISRDRVRALEGVLRRGG